MPERVSRYYKEPRKSHAKGILKIGKGVYNESIDKILNRILDRIEVSFVAKFLPLLLTLSYSVFCFFLSAHPATMTLRILRARSAPTIPIARAGPITNG